MTRLAQTADIEAPNVADIHNSATNAVAVRGDPTVQLL